MQLHFKLFFFANYLIHNCSKLQKFFQTYVIYSILNHSQNEIKNVMANARIECLTINIYRLQNIAI